MVGSNKSDLGRCESEILNGLLNDAKRTKEYWGERHTRCNRLNVDKYKYYKGMFGAWAAITYRINKSKEDYGNFNK